VRGSKSPDPLAGFLLAGIGFLLAAAAAAVVDAVAPWSWGGWVALHLALLGGVSQLVLGASQFFVAAFLATRPPDRRLTAAQLLLWPVGTVAVVVGVPAGVEALALGGAALLLVALALLAAALRGMEGRSLQRAAWAVRWYYAATAFLVVGALLGAELARQATWASGDLLSAHVTLNVLGWLGTAIVGTVHTFFPSLARTRLALPRLQRPTFWAWTGGVAALALGYLTALPPLAAAGLLATSAGALMLLANVLRTARTARSARGALSLPARLVLAGQLCVGAGLPLAASLAPTDPSQPFSGGVRAGLAALLLAGWVGLTVAGSLLHLLSIAPPDRRAAQPWSGWPQPLQHNLPLVATGGVAVLAAALMLGLPAAATLALCVVVPAAALLGAGIVRLAAALLRGRPRPP
jgi:nitrite reductase (NO-forming)